MDELLGPSAIAEARALCRMVGCDGNTVENLHELIVWCQHGLSEMLLACAWTFPEDSRWVERSLMFGAAVLDDWSQRMLRSRICLSIRKCG
jgi:hypothetical protein